MLQHPTRTLPQASPQPPKPGATSSSHSEGPCAKSSSTSVRAGDDTLLPICEHLSLDHDTSSSLQQAEGIPCHESPSEASLNTKAGRKHTLPPEIWRDILRQATIDSAQPFPSPSSPTSHNAFGWPCHPSFDDGYFRSLATKYNICLVSRQFNALAEDFLYETIHLRRPEQALQLVGRFAAFCDEPVDVATVDHSPPNDFQEVLRRLETGLELDLSLGLKALDINGTESETTIQPLTRLSKLEKQLKRFNKTLIIAPQFPPLLQEKEADFIDAALMALHSLAKTCTSAKDVFLTADHTSLFHGPTYQPWVRLLAALPQNTMHNLNVQDFLLGPVVWSPRLFRLDGAGSNLRSLHLDAEHPPIAHSFPQLTHLHLFSWPTASEWDMPSLSHLYIQYLPDVTATRSFWSYPPGHPRPHTHIHRPHTVHMRPPPHTFPTTRDAVFESESFSGENHEYGARREKLQLLHFGYDTDLGLYFPDLSARLAWLAPNLHTLEYHIAGDLPVRFDPRSLPRTLKSIKVQTLLIGGGMELPRWSEQDCMTDYTSATLSAMEEYWKGRLTPEAVRRWSQVCNHLRAYGEDQVKPMVLFPKSTTTSPKSRFS